MEAATQSTMTTVAIKKENVGAEYDCRVVLRKIAPKHLPGIETKGFSEFRWKKRRTKESYQKCSARGCKNLISSDGFSSFQFPTDDIRCKKRVCAVHLEDGQFQNLTKRDRLKSCAVPTVVVDNTGNLVCLKGEQIEPLNKPQVDESVLVTLQSENILERHSYCKPASEMPSLGCAEEIVDTTSCTTDNATSSIPQTTRRGTVTITFKRKQQTDDEKKATEEHKRKKRMQTLITANYRPKKKKLYRPENEMEDVGEIVETSSCTSNNTPNSIPQMTRKDIVTTSNISQMTGKETVATSTILQLTREEIIAMGLKQQQQLEDEKRARKQGKTMEQTQTLETESTSGTTNFTTSSVARMTREEIVAIAFAQKKQIEDKKRAREEDKKNERMQTLKAANQQLRTQLHRLEIKMKGAGEGKNGQIMDWEEAKQEKQESKQVIKKLNLSRHPVENGYWKLVYDPSAESGPDATTSGKFSTIYYLLEKGDFCPWHRMKTSRELWTHHKGGTMMIHKLSDNGRYSMSELGDPLLDPKACLQSVIEPNTWFALEIKNGMYTLATSACIPAFDPQDMEMLSRQEMINLFPHHKVMIQRFTSAAT